MRGAMGWIVIAGLLLLTGAVLAVVLRERRLQMGASIVTQAIANVLVLGVGFGVLRSGVSANAAWAWSFPLEVVRVRIDGLSAFFLSWSLPMTLLGTIYATGYLAASVRHGRNAGSHFALLNLTALSFLLIYTADNAFIFLFGWEIAAVAAWLLVIWDYKSQKVRFAGFNYLVSTHVGLFVLVAAFMIMHSATGTMEISRFAPFLAARGSLRDATFVLLVIACGLKSAFFPFHTWLPRAHAAAPAHVSALMSGVIHKAGLFALLRFTLLLGDPEPWMGWFVLGFSALSALLGVIYTTAQRDLKRLLGYSSTENVGIAGLGFGVGYLGLAWHRPALVVLGFTGGLLHVLNHALFKCLLFYAAGAVYRATHTVDLERLGGLAKRMPRTAIYFLAGGLAIAGLPPLNGFVSEFVIYAGLLNGGGTSGTERVALVATAALLAFVGAASALSITRAMGLAFLGQPRDRSVNVDRDLPAALNLAMAPHLAGIVAIGLAPGIGLSLVSRAAALFAPRGVSMAAASTVTQLVAPIAKASLALGALVLVLSLLAQRARRGAPRVETWGCGYEGATPRIQYTGTSFSAPFMKLFESFVRELRREKLPRGYFPREQSRVETHHADAVERRMFEALGNGESFIRQVANRIPEEPRFSFAAGLVVIVVIVALLVRNGGGAP